MIGDLIGFVFVFVHRGAAEVLVATLLGGALLSPELFFFNAKNHRGRRKGDTTFCTHWTEHNLDHYAQNMI